MVAAKVTCYDPLHDLLKRVIDESHGLRKTMHISRVMQGIACRAQLFLYEVEDQELELDLQGVRGIIDRLIAFLLLAQATRTAAAACEGSLGIGILLLQELYLLLQYLEAQVLSLPSKLPIESSSKCKHVLDELQSLYRKLSGVKHQCLQKKEAVKNMMRHSWSNTMKGSSSIEEDVLLLGKQALADIDNDIASAPDQDVYAQLVTLNSKAYNHKIAASTNVADSDPVAAISKLMLSHLPLTAVHHAASLASNIDATNSPTASTAWHSGDSATLEKQVLSYAQSATTAPQHAPIAVSAKPLQTQLQLWEAGLPPAQLQVTGTAAARQSPTNTLHSTPQAVRYPSHMPAPSNPLKQHVKLWEQGIQPVVQPELPSIAGFDPASGEALQPAVASQQHVEVEQALVQVRQMSRVTKLADMWEVKGGQVLCTLEEETVTEGSAATAAQPPVQAPLVPGRLVSPFQGWKPLEGLSASFVANVAAPAPAPLPLPDASVHLKEVRPAVTEEPLPSMVQQIDLAKDITGWGLCLGRGAFGSVYKAIYRGCPVAVKVMREHALNMRDLRSFQQEIALLSRLDHPNIVRLHGCCLAPPDVAVVQELMDFDLYDYIHRQRQDCVPLPEVLNIGLQIARGLAELHPTIVHRDLKPANILLDRHLHVKIADFGLARDKPSQYLSTCDKDVGTLKYMAPECIQNQNVTEACDIYSFGVLMYELLTGKEPWENCHPLYAVCQVQAGVMLELPPECPATLRTLIQSCWCANHRERPSSIQLVDKLENITQQLVTETKS